MKYSLILLFFFITACAQNFGKTNQSKPFNSKGFAYIYNNEDYENKIIKKKLDNNKLQIVHDSLRPGALIMIINSETNESIILKNAYKFNYPSFYKILITKTVANKLAINFDFPHVEILEIKKNKSFIAKETKIFKEEEKIHSSAPVEKVKIDNISKNVKKKKTLSKNNNFSIIVAEFYSKKSALLLKERISKELPNYDSKKLYIKSKKANKISLLSGPYKSINLMKNDYIELINFGFEELDVAINE